MKVLAFFIVLLCVSCSPDVEFRSAENSIDERFLPYVHAWMLNYKGDWPPGLKIQFGVPAEQDHETLAALCNRESNTKVGAWQHTIYVREDKWEKHGKYQREGTIIHELGHCVKGISKHEDIYVTHLVMVDGVEQEINCPTSYMTTDLETEETYEQCRTFLYQEMFGVEEEEIIWPNYKAMN